MNGELPEVKHNYTRLDEDSIIRTIEALRNRIASTFPQANLLRVCEQFLDVSKRVVAVEHYLRRPHWPLRIFGIAVYFLLRLETRVKRGRALKMLHALRSLTHIVDMHQLTKDPALITSAPEGMSPADLGRYLDFCSDMLSLIGKVSALMVQHFDDDLVLAAVNEIETLTTGLSRKMWQKITLLERPSLTG